MALDKSYFNANPSFVPGPNYKMGDFILAADAIDPRARIEAPEEPEDPTPPEEPEGPELPEDEEPEDEPARGRGAGGRGAGPGPIPLPPAERSTPRRPPRSSRER